MKLLHKDETYEIFKDDNGNIIFDMGEFGRPYNTYDEFINSYEPNEYKKAIANILRPHLSEYSKIEGIKQFTLRIPLSIHARLKDNEININKFITDAIIEKLHREK